MASTQKTFAIILGAVLVLIGLIGFFNDPVLGIFNVNVLHNWVHLGSGLALLGVAMWGSTAATRTANITFGVVYGLVTILGFLGLAQFLDVQPGLASADNWLHLLITAAALTVGFAAEKY